MRRLTRILLTLGLIVAGAAVVSIATVRDSPLAAPQNRIDPSNENSQGNTSPGHSDQPSSHAGKNNSNGNISLNSLANSIREAGDPNFSGIELNEKLDSIQVYTAGSAGVEIKEILAAAKLEGFKTSLMEDARFSRNQLLWAARQVSESVDLVEKYQITSVSALSDGCGIEVTFAGSAPSKSGLAEIGQRARVGNAIKSRAYFGPIKPQ